MQKIGINTNNECGLDFFEICDNIKNCGFESIMIALNHEREENQFEYVSKLGLDISFVHLDNTHTNDMWVKGFAHDMQIKIYKNKLNYVRNLVLKSQLCMLQLATLIQ